MRRLTGAIVALLVCLVMVPAAASAQQTKRKRPPTKGPVAPGTVDPSINSSQLVLAAWLDDADTPEANAGFVDLAVSRWQASDAALTDLPSVDFGVGMTNQLQLGGSASFTRATYSGAASTAGIGTVNLESKYQVLDPHESVVGLAVSPLVEILSPTVAKDPALRVGRVGVAIPVTLEVAGDQGAVYGTVTYFSRGVASAALEAERTVGKVTLAGLVTYAYATRLYFENASEPTLRSRTDIAGELYVQATDRATIYGSVGRTVSTLDLNAAKLTATVGLKLEWSPKAR